MADDDEVVSYTPSGGKIIKSNDHEPHHFLSQGSAIIPIQPPSLPRSALRSRGSGL